MIMKKYSAVVLAVFLCGAPVFAAGNVVAPKLIDQLEQTVYGEVRAGSLVGRLDAVEKDLYGTKLQGRRLGRWLKNTTSQRSRSAWPTV